MREGAVAIDVGSTLGLTLLGGSRGRSGVAAVAGGHGGIEAIDEFGNIGHADRAVAIDIAEFDEREGHGDRSDAGGSGRIEITAEGGDATRAVLSDAKLCAIGAELIDTVGHWSTAEGAGGVDLVGGLAQDGAVAS